MPGEWFEPSRPCGRLLTKPEPKLTKAEEIEVKKVARELLTTLKAEKLVLDYKK